MASYIVKKSNLQGSVKIPSSKSQSMRAVLFATLADGCSRITNLLPSPDLKAMIAACKMIGATIKEERDYIEIIGVAGKLKTPTQLVNVGNSGIVLRFFGAIVGLCSGHTIITGDASVCSLRPAGPLLSGLSQLGAHAVSVKGNDYAPFIIKGPMKAGTATIQGFDSQPVSGLLIASSLLSGSTDLFVENPGETPWVEMTLYWLRKMGIEVDHENYKHYLIQGKNSFPAFEYMVPGDFSTAAFPLIAALVTESEISVENLDFKDVQGDKILISLLQERGAQMSIDHQTLHIRSDGLLDGGAIEINKMIDALPIISVLALTCKGPTHIYGGAIARCKESDRIAAMCGQLSLMGADIEEKADGLVVWPSKLKGTKVKSLNDHRVAMALSIAGMMAEGETIVEDIACVSKSYPGFLDAMQSLGAQIQQV